MRKQQNIGIQIKILYAIIQKGYEYQRGNSVFCIELSNLFLTCYGFQINRISSCKIDLTLKHLCKATGPTNEVSANTDC